MLWKHGHGRVLSVKVFDGVTDRFDASMDVIGNLADHFRQIFSLGGQSPSSIDDFVTFEFGHLAEAFAAFNPKSVLSDKALDTRMEKTHSLSAFGDEPSRH